MRLLLLSVLAVGAFLVNPFVACGDVAFQYGEAEMRAAVVGTWRLTLPGGQPQVITFTIEQATSATQTHSTNERGLISSAAACGHRTFVKSAEACLDTSDMPLTMIAIGDSRPTLRGRFVVTGTTFKNGLLEIQIGDTTSVTAEISKTGKVTTVSSNIDSATLTRL